LRYIKIEKLTVAAFLVFGLLLLFKTETAHAGSESGDGRKHPVDGGYFLEEPALDELDRIDDLFILSGQDVPPPAITPSYAAALPDIRIMPLGDSITKGFGFCSLPDPILNCTGYREDLWNSLKAGGYSVDFVGSLGSTYQSQYTYDNDHEGHGGKTADWLIDRVYGSTEYFLQDNPADIVLLHIGTNDFTNFPLPNPNDVAAEVNQVLNKIDNYENGEEKVVLVILAKIIKRYESAEQTTAIENYNNALQSMADLRIAGGDNIFVVDMESALTHPTDFLNDDLHPNENGYTKMAAVWYAALVEVLNFPPSLTNPGSQSSIQGQTVYLQMQATDPENDSLTYSAAGLPDGLTINPNTGEISGKISSSNSSGSILQVTITADDKTGFPYTDPYNKGMVIFSWEMGDQVVLPLVIR
jgi:lysophospholipase L1-like esterase